MQAAAGIGTLLLIVIGGIVGMRLMLLSRKTGEWPEFCVGMALFSFSFVSQVAAALSIPAGEWIGRPAALACMGVSMLGAFLTHGGVAAFNWMVFRRDSRTALLAASALSLTTFAGSVYVFAQLVRFEDRAIAQTHMALPLAIIAAVGLVLLGWTSVESFRYYALMRRRLAIGLADPVLVNRFWVWGLGCGSGAISSGAVGMFAYRGANLVEDPAPMLVLATAGVVCSVGWYLSFLAPRAYQDWIRRRAQVPASEA